MSPMTVGIIRHFISGDAYFTGIAVLFLMILWWSTRGWRGLRWVWGAGGVGAGLILLSATPERGMFSVSIWLVFGVALFASQFCLQRKSHGVEGAPHVFALTRLSLRATLILIALLLTQGISEWQFLALPDIHPGDAGPIVVIGDSVTAGIGENEATTWPSLLSNRISREILDLSRMGATLRSTVAQLPDQLPADSLVIIELGGNDLLGTTSVAEFRRDLEVLLKKVAPNAAQTVMFELPLPPFYNRFGAAQRELAAKYQVYLIPRFVLTNILISPQTTLDSIHLNQAGHDKMADFVTGLLMTAKNE